MIKFDQVTKKFGEITALEDLTFEVTAGEIAFLTGPSGSGKTTLIRLIIKELEPTSGKIFIEGSDLEELKSKYLPQLRRKIGVVFQDLKLLMDRTVRENVRLALEIAGEVQNLDERVNEVLELTGISNRAELFPNQLAGGELQRVCLARAIVTEPEILIADEPTGNLDVTTSWQIMNLLQKLNDLGKTVLIATHNLEIVNSFKHRVIELDQGRLIRDEKKGKYKVR